MGLLMCLRGPVAAPCRAMGISAARAHPTCSLRSPFLGMRSQMTSLQCSFSGLSLRTDGPSVAARGRRSFVVEANSKTALGITKRGTRRARTRTSGFRARMRTPNGRMVIKARRRKGRKTLCPATNFHK